MKLKITRFINIAILALLMITGVLSAQVSEQSSDSPDFDFISNELLITF